MSTGFMATDEVKDERAQSWRKPKIKAAGWHWNSFLIPYLSTSLLTILLAQLNGTIAVIP